MRTRSTDFSRASLAFAGAAYPFALAGQTTMDYWLGDAILIRELQHGSARSAAIDLLLGYWSSIPWIAVVWLGVVSLRSWLRGAYFGVACAASLLLVAAATAGALPLPPVLAWLLLATVALDALARMVGTVWTARQAGADPCD